MRCIHPVLRVRALTKEYQRGSVTWPSASLVLRGIDLDVYGDEIVTVIAPKGWGKSTLLLCLSGLLRPTSGLVQWAFPHEAILGESQDPSTEILYLPQHISYYNFLTVRETLDYYGVTNSVTPTNWEQTLDDALRRVGLTAVTHTPIRELGVSMIRRVQIAQALVRRPKALLLDETLSGTDPTTYAVLRDIILDLAAAGTVVIAATHDIQLARQLKSRHLLLDQMFTGRRDMTVEPS